MSGFEIGCIGARYEGDYVTVSLVDRGIQVHASAGMAAMSFGGWATLMPSQVRELGHLLLKAADNFDDLQVAKKQIEGEQSALGKRTQSLMKRALFGQEQP